MMAAELYSWLKKHASSTHDLSLLATSLSPVTCFPALATSHMFSRACHQLHVFPRLPSVTCFSALAINYILPQFLIQIILSQGSLLGISEDVKEQLSDAATHTSKAYAAVRRGRDPDAEVEPTRPMPSTSLFGTDLQSTSGKHEVKTMSPEVLVMKPILRFLQLLCENHNRDLQVSELEGSFS